MRRARPLSFDIRSSSAGRPRAIARCALCGRDGSVALPNGKDWEPTTIAKLFSREGWEFDSHTARKFVCPPCIGERVRVRKGDKPPVKQKASTPAPTRTVQDLKSREKAAVRHLLDLHFDDARGSYIDGYSDQRVGKECNVPWALVTAMREAAYGEIVVDDDAETLRKEKEALRTALGELKIRLDGLLVGVEALGGKIDRFAQDRRV